MKPTDRPNFELLAEILQALHEESIDLIQLERYPPDEYIVLDSNRPDEIIWDLYAYCLGVLVCSHLGDQNIPSW